jgi:DNA-binding LytR/AlgR family response regulator
MLDALRRPVPLPWLIAGVVGAALAVALYCIGYAALSGRSESLSAGLGWALANICPWLVAIEIGKRARGWPDALAVLALAFVASLLLGFATGASDASFELWRRLPSLLAAAAAIALLRSSVGTRQIGSGEIPLLPRQIDWVRAAGNYVELRAAGQTIVHRASLSAVEHRLSNHGFVRIHRSMLVRRDRIARIRTADVVLADGTHLKIGKRYRAALAA